MTSIDYLLLELGDCGLFQCLVVLFIHGSALPGEWVTTFMAYGLYNPGFTCNLSNSSDVIFSKTDNDDSSLLFAINESNFKNYDKPFRYDQLCHRHSTCEDVTYSADSSTIVTEWDLACDRNWIASLILSVEVCGLIFGMFGAGYLSNVVGRKPTHFWGLAFLIGLHVAATYSVNWQMFAAIRFFIGVTNGSLGVSNFVYPMEFLTDKWRAVVAALPFASIGGVLFAATAWVLRDWRNLHLATALFASGFFLCVCCVPESLRWLIMARDLSEADEVVAKIANVNRSIPMNHQAITIISKREHTSGRSKGNYSVFDLYRHFMQGTVAVTFIWTSVLVCHTIVMFGIRSLSGDFYLNLMLFHLFPTLFLPFVPLLTNTIGRKWANVLLLVVACACSIGLVGSHFMSGDSNREIVSLLLSVIFDLLLLGEWSVLMLFCVEMYPTPLRSLSYSHSHCIARLGGVVAPFLIPHNNITTFISHCVMALLTVVSLVFAFLLPETKGQHLNESVP